jgi:hypothetical protein
MGSFLPALSGGEFSPGPRMKVQFTDTETTGRLIAGCLGNEKVNLRRDVTRSRLFVVVCVASSSILRFN